MAVPANGRFVSLDLEVTGLDPKHAEIIEVGLVAFDRSGIGEKFSSLVKPKGEVPYSIQTLTGITPEELEGAPTWDEIRARVAAFIGDSPVVGQSVEFDLAHLRGAGLYPKGGELDTFHLASIFLPGLPSYRLEAIAEAVGVELSEAHRALPDAEATAEVLLSLLGLIEARVSPELGAELGGILARSDYGLRLIWGELAFRGGEPPQVTAPPAEELAEPSGAAVRFVREVMAASGDVVGLAGARTRLLGALTGLNDANGSMLVALPSLRQTQWLAEALGAGLELSGEHYLSRSRAEAYLGQERFSTRAAVFALKLRYFFEWTRAGRRDELPLYDVEYQLWRLLSQEGLSTEELARDPWAPSREGAGLRVTNHRSLEELRTPGTLVIADFQLLDEVLSSALTVSIDQRDGELLSGEARSGFDMLLGLAGIVLEHFSEPSAYGRVLRLRPSIMKSREWSQFRAAAEHFTLLGSRGETIERRLLERTQGGLRRLLESAESEIAWIAERPSGLSLKIAPRALGPTLEELRLEAARTVIFTKSLEGVPDVPVIRESGEEPGPEVLVVRPDGEPERAVLERVLGEFEGDGRAVGVFCPSASMIREVFEPLSEALDRELIGTGFSGSESRLVALFQEDPRRVLLAGPRLWTDDRLDESFDVIIAPRLSFDPPGEPLHQARSEVGGAFMGYSLPRAAAKLRALVAKLRPGGRLVLLDRRIGAQRYGQELIALLDLPTEEIGLGELALAEEPKD